MCGRMNTRGIEFSSFDVTESEKVKYRQLGGYNVALTSHVAMIRNDVRGEREVAEAVWNFKPSWAPPESSKLLYNARAETVSTRPSFRSAFKTRRCLIPARGYYEWRKPDKQPFYFTRADDAPLALGGIYEEGDDAGLSACIITTAANGDTGAVHDRMPLILPREQWPRWLSSAPLTDQEKSEFLVPAPCGTLASWPVNRAVGNVRNDGPDLIQAAPETPLTLQSDFFGDA